ncbi:hypothetical protein DK842_20565 [Chromobacterium phragmitis]|uniref:DUF488 domain-containing protein n=1 Tax=Chromobacterium phragmitis TaxID=2202141 RepID=UPI000DED2E31|nr:DUF488 family protein [Chromobacterium phragmitis]AXE32079.1 hypothetical protein DK842_20565 [Chromobacterium phragmitis]
MGIEIRLVQVDGCRKPPAGAFLVDGKWPRGLPRSALAAGHWLPRVMPTDELVAWMRYQPLRWSTFCDIYWSDMGNNPGRWLPLLRTMEQGELVLLHSGEADEHSPVKALESFLTQRYRERQAETA